MKPECWKVFAAVITPNIGGVAGGLLVNKRTLESYYGPLKKPSWTPPNWVFGPVWTSLYSSMGYASYLVYKECNGLGGDAKLPMILFGTQLALNWAWTPIFFWKHDIKLSLIDIGLLWVAAGACGVSFYNVNHTAGLLFIPYMAWLTLASALNYRIYKDNPKIKEIVD